MPGDRFKCSLCQLNMFNNQYIHMTDLGSEWPDLNHFDDSSASSQWMPRHLTHSSSRQAREHRPAPSHQWLVTYRSRFRFLARYDIVRFRPLPGLTCPLGYQLILRHSRESWRSTSQGSIPCFRGNTMKAWSIGTRRHSIFPSLAYLVILYLCVRRSLPSPLLANSWSHSWRQYRRHSRRHSQGLVEALTEAVISWRHYPRHLGDSSWGTIGGSWSHFFGGSLRGTVGGTGGVEAFTKVVFPTTESSMSSCR